jgi:hypothetical protein
MLRHSALAGACDCNLFCEAGEDKPLGSELLEGELYLESLPSSSQAPLPAKAPICHPRNLYRSAAAKIRRAAYEPKISSIFPANVKS